MNHFEVLLNRYPVLQSCKDDIQHAFDMLCKCYKNGGKVLVCGNGGSAADSEHIVGELMKGFLLHRPLDDVQRGKLMDTSPEDGRYIADNLQGALPAISLVSHSALMTAFSNDVAPDMVFAQQVYGYARGGDVLIGISTSGSSKNVVYAAHTAKMLGASTIALTGSSGGGLLDICDVTVRVPSDSTPDIQELHLPVYHALCAMVEAEFFE